VEDNKEILVFPRRCIQSSDRFVPWSDAAPVILCASANVAWLPRQEAEKSKEWVQPIPCAFIRDHTHRYCILLRTRQTRADLRDRISLIVGGHVDRSFGHDSLPSLLLLTLKRELNEELGIQSLSKVRPVGLVVDSLSIKASRHIAFIYEVAVESPLTVRAAEEFALRSKFTGYFSTPEELSQFHTKFDPWSLLLFEDYINPSSVRMARQNHLFDD
jgi:predicted NUDIX family phosphoesterase